MSQQDPATFQAEHVRVPYHREMPFQLPDPSTAAGQQIARRLHDDLFLWLTTVDEQGVPHALPLGFLWDEAQATFLIYSMQEADRDHVRHIRHNPKVCLHYDFAMSGDPLVFTGEAVIRTDYPLADQIPAWVEKYQPVFSQMGMTMQQSAALAPIAVHVRPLTMLVSSWITQ